MGFKLKKNVKSIIPVPITVGSQPEPDGSMPSMVHLMAIPEEGYRIDKFIDRIREAGTGEKGDAERDAAVDLAYFAIWESRVRGVRDYEDIPEGASIEQVVAYFKGERMPEGASEGDGDLYREALLVHVKEAVNQFLARFPMPQRIR